MRALGFPLQTRSLSQVSINLTLPDLTAVDPLAPKYAEWGKRTAELKTTERERSMTLPWGGDQWGRDVLDKAVRDRSRREMGRVDGIVLDHTPGEPPRLSVVLIGPSALADRVHPLLKRWLIALQHAFGLDEEPVRIEFRHLARTGRYLIADVEVAATAAGVLERRLGRWLRRIPRP